MAVFRVERNTGYTVMSNHHLRNKELTLKAKGLLSQMLSLPDVNGKIKCRKSVKINVDYPTFYFTIYNFERAKEKAQNTTQKQQRTA